MKKLLILLLCLFTTDSFGSGIASNSAYAPCTNNTLETYSGNSNLAADWQPNTINLRWYNEDEKLTVQQSAQSCTYDGTLTVPQTQPTRTGYTFAGWEVKHTIPAGYTELEYIQSQNTGEYIDTGFVPRNDYRHTIVFEAMSANDVYLCGTGATFIRSGNIKLSKYKIIGILNGVSSADAVNILSEQLPLLTGKNTLVIDLHDNAKCYVQFNGDTISTRDNTASIISRNSLNLFTSDIGWASSIRIYADSIEQNGSAVRNFVPARRNSDNAIGMWDTVTQTFFTNAGSGSFIAGPVVTE